jgi:hypothetical protein
MAGRANPVIAKHAKEAAEAALRNQAIDNLHMAEGLLESGDIKLAGEKYLLAGQALIALAETREGVAA